jgi:beta-glucosidase
VTRFAVPFVIAIIALSATAQAPTPDSPEIAQRVANMLSHLTIEQKIDLIGGEHEMFVRAEPDAGFPQLKMANGPVGIGYVGFDEDGRDTIYTSGIALAAAWDPALAARVGAGIGKDARARGVHFLLGPGVNIYRAPMSGRNFEYFGEDPFLSSRMAVSYIIGVQDQGVIATVKHFAANDSEFDRHNLSSDVDERTLREIYLPPFEAAIREAHAGSVMDSYNLINGIHATQNKHLNLDILKKEWGFNGIIMSDWDATYNAIDAANNGLDLEMPFGKYMNRETLLPAIQKGEVKEATIDDKVRRIIRTAIRFHFLDQNQLDSRIPAYSQEASKVALDEARESIVLLKNEGTLLPLDTSRIHTIAVFGPDAHPAVPGGGGSSTVIPFSATSLLTGLSDAVNGKIKVLYLRGLPTVAEIYKTTNFKNGLKVETFDNPNFSGSHITTHLDHLSQFATELWTPPTQKRISIRYSGTYVPAITGQYLLLGGAFGSDVYKLTVDGKVVLEQKLEEGQAPHSTQIFFTANHPVSIQFDYLPDSDTPRAGFGIRLSSNVVNPEVAEMAAGADVAIVAAGYDPSTECEGFDRTFALPWGQDELIRTVAAANKKTIVTLTAGGGIDTQRWLNNVPALLHNWYPGQEGGKALAEILLGERSPEGHLPVTLEKSWEQNPVHDSYYPALIAKGQTPHVKYSEGLYVGYRYYTSRRQEPLFPFGFGLSYTTFSFSNLRVTPESSDGSLIVSFDVANIGHREGADVAQVYIGDPSAKVDRPVKELKGFDKVRLAAGQKKHVSIKLDHRSFAYWDVSSNDWRIDSGQFKVYVGDSSVSTPLTSSFTIKN